MGNWKWWWVMKLESKHYHEDGHRRTRMPRMAQNKTGRLDFGPNRHLTAANVGTGI